MLEVGVLFGGFFVCVGVAAEDREDLTIQLPLHRPLPIPHQYHRTYLIHHIHQPSTLTQHLNHRFTLILISKYYRRRVEGDPHEGGIDCLGGVDVGDEAVDEGGVGVEGALEREVDFYLAGRRGFNRGAAGEDGFDLGAGSFSSVDYERFAGFDLKVMMVEKFRYYLPTRTILLTRPHLHLPHLPPHLHLNRFIKTAKHFQFLRLKFPFFHLLKVAQLTGNRLLSVIFGVNDTAYIRG